MLKILMQLLVVSFLLLEIGCKRNIQLNSSADYDNEILLYRTQYLNDFINNPRSPLEENDLVNLDFYAPDQRYCIVCDFSHTVQSQPFEMPTYSGITRTYKLYGIAKCKVINQIIELELYSNLSQPGNPLFRNLLFLPFKDTTNGEETYGGGRYINLTLDDIVNGKIQIDFNKCYNPYCAYSEGFNCPIPPKPNQLSIAIKAGERSYKGEVKQVPGD